jgi:hypothetical protein
MDLARLRQREYVKRLAVNALRREVFEQADPAASDTCSTPCGGPRRS